MRTILALACLLFWTGETCAGEAAYYIYGSECPLPQNNNPPVCYLIGWPTESDKTQFADLPWTYPRGQKADKLSTQPATVAKADAR